MAHATDTKQLHGAFALADGRTLYVVGEDGPAELRYGLSTGEYGVLKNVDSSWVAGGAHPYLKIDFKPDSADQCTLIEIKADRHTEATRIPLIDKETTFESSGVKMYGHLVLPANGQAEAVAIWAQGSGSDSAVNDEEMQYMLPMHGVGMFIFDKRGTGKSLGELSANLYERADDTVAAIAEARRLYPTGKSFGVFGGSQGGWVAPLAASKTNVDFVVVGYGLVEGVTSQDRDIVEDQLRVSGYGDEDVAKARVLTDATEKVARSGWQTGYEEVARLQKLYANEPWLSAIGPNGYTGQMLKFPMSGPADFDKVRVMAPKMDLHISFNYDPRPVVSKLVARQLWVLGGSDHTAPSGRTIPILKEIQKTRHLDLAVFRAADHGIIIRFERDGAKRARYADGYVDMVAHWIKTGKANPRYGVDLSLGARQSR